MKSTIEQSFKNLKTYCEKENYKGYDPYDGLNSKLFQSIPFINKNGFFQLAWIQFFKRSPINFRKLVGIKKEYNPKGLGLFLLGYSKLYQLNNSKENKNRITFLADTLLKLQTKGYSGACWGYNFDWKARAFFLPKRTPTVVATSFIAEAFIEAYEITKNEQYLQTAISAAQFILKDLNRTYDNNDDFSFSYSPLDKTQVFNASLLGAKLLALVYNYTKDRSLLTEAKKAVNYVCKRQNKNGSWAYGTLPFHQWIDSFHTGYNLESIYIYQKYTKDFDYNEHINKGKDYYLKNFFTKEGIPKYYNNKIYPIDVHAPAQLIVTLAKLDSLSNNKKLVDQVLHWTINVMQSLNGHFYYQKRKYFTNRISYMRWSQAWMFYAFSYYLNSKK
ncbi:MAG TPA: delta-aminolevulinic acid dehydratase [Bacteroidia bacterium]|nr:delta-aminolevulinic acid dehydratase [Bacteroidia bacterium]